VLRKKAKTVLDMKYAAPAYEIDTIRNTWTVTFDSTKGGPAKPVVFEQLQDWSKNNDPAIKYYSGTALYTASFVYNKYQNFDKKVWLNVGSLANIATVYVNGISCGVIWTAPYRLDISRAISSGEHKLRIFVTNTWFNRLKGDLLLPEKERITQTNAPFWGKDKPLLPAGLLGPVTIEMEE
jgi:hypothetical protein